MRMTYQELMEYDERGNLALMEQDLLNYAQTNIKIHRLPNQWLWCEAWCDQEDFDDALIIDFCGDPKKPNESKILKAQRYSYELYSTLVP